MKKVSETARRLGAAIVAAKAYRGIQKREIAKRAGLSNSYFTQISTGQRNPPLATVVAIAEALDLQPHELIALMYEDAAAPAGMLAVLKQHQITQQGGNGKK